MSSVPTIAVVNESTTLAAADVQPLADALHWQVANHFRPHYNAGARIEVLQSIPAHAWGLVILDDADQAGALGYHDLTAAGLPLAKVFARTTLDDGGQVSIVASHELLEMLGDPWIDSAVQVGSQTFYALEVADACEGDQYGYAAPNGVVVSDFVLPSWWRQGSAGPFDYMGHIARPLELLPGGYIGAWTPSTGWTQKTADASAPESRRVPLRRRKFAGESLELSTRWQTNPDG